tara:strand:+ start:164 stop:1024 length:861 start_codon:yes stop_codon:yes gene_type:complete
MSCFSHIQINDLSLILNTGWENPLNNTPKGSATMKGKQKLTANQERIQTLIAFIKARLLVFLEEPGRLWADTPTNRECVRRKVKGCAIQFGPRLNQTAESDVIYKFELGMLMYVPRADMDLNIDLDDFFSTGEQYTGETHLHLFVPWSTWMMVVKRVVMGIADRDGNKLSETNHLRQLASLARVLRHIETISCWQNEGVNTQTGEAFLYKWPAEVAHFPNAYHRFELNERAYDGDWYNAFGTGYVANPDKAEPTNFDDPVHPDDAKREVAKELRRQRTQDFFNQEL